MKRFTHKSVFCVATAIACTLTVGAAQAQNVALAGMMGKVPLLVINGSAPKAVPVGQSHMGVKVLAATGDQATLLNDGQRLTVKLGESPVDVGGISASASQGEDVLGDVRRIVLSQTSGGHFSGNGTINGKVMRFVVDTGATYVTLGAADADRMGVNYKSGKRVPMQTANGISVGWTVKLGSVRVGSVQIHEVDAVVTPNNMGFILLGNSFLNRFAMTRNGEQMILDRRY